MKISIIVPVYNKIKYIQSLLNMIKNQSFEEYECIIIDDGSSDGSGDVCDAIAAEDNRFIVKHIQNSGVSHARNVGLDLAKGSYITFIDSDDELSPLYLENLFGCLKKNNADMVIGSFTQISDGTDWKKEIHYPFEDRLYSMEELLPSFAELQKNYGLFGWCWAKLIKKDKINNARFNEEMKLAEDFEFYLKIYPNIHQLCFDKTSSYYYRLNAENGSMISAKDDEIDYYSQLKLNLKYRDYLNTVGAFSDKNKFILNQLLSKYSFYTLFHSDLKDFSKQFKRVRLTWMNNGYPLKGFNFHSYILLGCLKNNCEFLARIYLLFYQNVRILLRSH